MRKTFIKIISTIYPRLIVKMAMRNLMNPQVLKLRPHEVEILDQSQKSTIDYKSFQIQRYKWGTGDKPILLIHGWEGQAGNFADVIPELVEAGFTVYAFDAPSHGYSSKGETSIFDFIEVVTLMLRDTQTDYVISHSFGGVATVSALYFNPDIHIYKYALITTPDRFRERIDDVAAMVGISDKIKSMLIDRLEQDLDRSVDDYNVSDFVQAIQVDHAFIIHDIDDKVIPIDRTRRVHQRWSQSTMVEVSGTGHFRILRSPVVIRQVVDFLSDSWLAPKKG